MPRPDSHSQTLDLPLHRCQSLDRVQVAIDHVNQQSCLHVGLGTSYLPVFQWTGVGAQVVGENGAGELELLSDGLELVSKPP
jgi:hypothetical protein